MKIIAGVDVGNSTTEVCLASYEGVGKLTFLSSSSTKTTGTKGTVENIYSIKTALLGALGKAGLSMTDLSIIRLNEAAPVIGDSAMETLTETVITGSTMIGHNPSTPAGVGQAVGVLLPINSIVKANRENDYILTVPSNYGYEEVAKIVNSHSDIKIRGIILQADEAVLVENRLDKKIPIIDEVKYIERLPEGELASIEVALSGQSIKMLSNPYGIATLLNLSPEETRIITPVAKSLVGKRSAVVVKTPAGRIHENTLPAGEIYVKGDRDIKINLDEGAEKIMSAMSSVGKITDIQGQKGTNVGNMFERIRSGMTELNGNANDVVNITDVLAVDTLAPVKVSGALAGETCLEKAVGIAAMVKTGKLPMREIAERLRREIGCEVVVAGVEAAMASLGALTTPGARLPLCILDMGGGSTDSAVMTKDGRVSLTHRAGAGELVTMLIDVELGLENRLLAEQIKKYPLAKVESLFHVRTEDGHINFVSESIDPRFFGRVVLITEDGYIRIEKDIPMEKIVQVRREAKRKVFITNAFRALSSVAPNGDLKSIPNVVLVGGSAEDFEIPEMLTEEFAKYRIVCGRGNVRKTEGPRNAVATGLVLSYLGEDK